MDPDFDDDDLGGLLEAPEWAEAHRALDASGEGSSSGPGDYHDLYEVIPLWLYARECLEEEEAASASQSSSTDADTGTPPRRQRRFTPAALPRRALALVFAHLQLDLDAQKDGNPYAWLPAVARVCKPWRNAAYAARELWTFIDVVSYPKEVVRSLLMMTDDLPLVVTGDTSRLGADADGGGGEDEDEDLEIKVELVMDEQARIRTLDLNVASAKHLKLFPWKTMLKSPWPYLTSLSLSGSTHVERKRRELPPLRARNFPSLKTLSLDRLHPKWEESELPTVEILEVRRVRGSRDAFDGFVGRCAGGVDVKEEGCRFYASDSPPTSRRNKMKRG